jgi:hypothetical protein
MTSPACGCTIGGCSKSPKVFLCEVTPALQFESLIETTFALAQE